MSLQDGYEIDLNYKKHEEVFASFSFHCRVECGERYESYKFEIKTRFSIMCGVRLCSGADMLWPIPGFTSILYCIYV